MPRVLSLLIAVATAFAAANLYYVQPLLPALAKDFAVSDSVIALAMTAGQIGFVVGVLFLLPLGDVLARNRLVPAMLTAVAAGQLLTATTSTTAVVFGGAIVIGIGSAASQVLVPFAGALTPAELRATVVARTVGALLTGILLARLVSGVVATAAGWRAVYVGSAVILVVLAAALLRYAPGENRTLVTRPHYRSLLTSMLTLLRTETWLRWIIISGAGTFGAFSMFWTAIPFLLAGDEYGWSPAQIGALSLVGIGGILAARRVGPWYQRGLSRNVTILGLVLVVTAFALAIPGAHLLAALVTAAIVMDVGVQSVHAINQCTVVGYTEEIRSRANAMYMTHYFLSGAIGSALAPWLADAGGWTAVCLAGGGAVSVAAFAWVMLGRSLARPSRDSGTTSSRARPSPVGDVI
ncbi:MFS transporter [Rhodococcus sp. IEGM 1366]|uniref:MFS transporter n=1 Tax=Rhodococcus sp. IEGM 1366 TaxID=3082223 RepID=UPI002952BA15|nr:MFS transporter [Rhodococcus sp. IEGM 1366]MDV8071301.1 MFS transporter [Rhodococcus sp. IEGM 1366]